MKLLSLSFKWMKIEEKISQHPPPLLFSHQLHYFNLDLDFIKDLDGI